MARVCVFDVNETLLDLRALDPLFERAFGDAGVRRSWFQQVLQSAFLATITGAYSDFGAIGAAALEMTAEREGVRLSEEDRRKLTVERQPARRGRRSRTRGRGRRRSGCGRSARGGR